MNIMLFLGSGISRPSGLPSVDQITDSILSGDWYDTGNHGTQHESGPHTQYHRIEDKPSLKAQVENCRRSGNEHRDTKEVKPIQQFLKVLKTNADEYFFVTKRSRKANYEDLYYLADQLEDEETAEVDNPAIEPFWRAIKEQSEFAGLCSGDEHDSSSEPTLLRRLAKEACSLIADVVIQDLWVSQRVEPKGLDAVSELARSRKVGGLDIFTLNHDCLMERLFFLNDVPISDGFGDPSDAGIRFFDRSTYDAKTKVRLFKLHGSIDWRHYGGIVASQVGLQSCDPPELCGLRPYVLKNRILLVGTYNKIADYGAGVFSELHWRFHQALQEHDTIIVSGYGWNDHAINRRLVDWLRSPDQKRLILFHKNPDEIWDKPRVDGWSYDSLRENGKLDVVPEFLCDGLGEMKALLGL